MNRSNIIWPVLILLGLGAIILIINHDQGSSFGLSNDDFGSLVFYGAIIAVLSVGLLQRRLPITEMVRNIGIWVLIFLVLMFGYTIRYELQDIASRVTAGLIPGSPLTSVNRDGQVNVSIEKMLNGHFEASLRVNNIPMRAMVDTGATSTVLTSEDAQRVGIDLSNLRFDLPVSTANGTTMAAAAHVNSIAIGDISRSNLPVLVAQSGQLDQSLLGMNFLSRLSGIDMRGDRMILHD